ncbi:MarR family winged helix-turn-helix transcriptional regulator [Williamsia sp.]|uniref:MarR family winged helix-turn-helix transcriptional regulator n=1 Tax=Williamsia sp. TaxID=1872085 RepID=UPI002F94B3EB
MTASSTAASLSRDLARIARGLRAGSNKSSLPLSSLSALWVLNDAGAPIRLSELAERETLTVPTMSRIVAALERDGLVVRTADPADGRASLLVPSHAGVELVNGNRSRRVQALERALDGLDATERDVLARALRKIAEELTEHPQA